MDFCPLNQKQKKSGQAKEHVRIETIITQLQSTWLQLHELLVISLEIPISAFFWVYFLLRGECSVSDIFHKPKCHISSSGNRILLHIKLKYMIRLAEYIVSYCWSVSHEDKVGMTYIATPLSYTPCPP
jgi:hypothetical protein